MKNIKFFSALFVLISALTFTSCETEPVDPALNENNNSNEPAVFQVDFNDETFVATSTQAVIADGMIVISGMKASTGESVSLAIEGTSEGAYDGEEAFMVYSPELDSEYQYVNLSDTGEDMGSVVITEIDTENHTVSGTFSFTGWWSDDEANLPEIVFTAGSFENIPYTGNIGGNPGDEYLNATIDGVETEFSNFAVMEVGETMNITGFSVASSSQIQLRMPVDITVGTYTITDNPFAGPTALYVENGEGASSVSGTLIITSIEDGFIEGTFEFDAENIEGGNIVEVTNGEFYIELL